MNNSSINPNHGDEIDNDDDLEIEILNNNKSDIGDNHNNLKVKSSRPKSKRSKKRMSKTEFAEDTLPIFQGIIGDKYNRSARYFQLECKEYDENDEKDPNKNPFHIHNETFVKILKEFHDNKMDATREYGEIMKATEALKMALGCYIFSGRTMFHGLKCDGPQLWEEILPTHSGAEYKEEDVQYLREFYKDSKSKTSRLNYEQLSIIQSTLLGKEGARYRRGGSVGTPPMIRKFTGIKDKYKNVVQEIMEIVGYMIEGQHKIELLVHERKLIVGIIDDRIYKRNFEHVDESDLKGWGIENSEHRKIIKMQIVTVVENRNKNEE